MPTEVTPDTRRSVSHVAETVQKQNAVIGANRSEGRQALSKDGQSMPPTKESNQASNQQLLTATDNMNKHVQNLKRDLYFSIDDETGDTIIRVVDSESHKTIRTIPSEEFLSMSQQLNQSVGLLLNAQA
ncbi:MAG: flagellar protein FlaG [Proteobacteria bacterium]|nr:flagellar protein FlaG [Pseudomonadota bacterium]NOG58930.1 flagellar protein FlaG [Pseudomonadota bacterium]